MIAVILALIVTVFCTAVVCFTTWYTVVNEMAWKGVVILAVYAAVMAAMWYVVLRSAGTIAG